MNCGGGPGGGNNGEDGPGDAENVENEEPCDEALALVLQLSGTSTVRVGCSSGNCLRKSGMKMEGFCGTAWSDVLLVASGMGWGCFVFFVFVVSRTSSVGLSIGSKYGLHCPAFTIRVFLPSLSRISRLWGPFRRTIR